ncbi:GTP-binding protein [Mangrovibacterium sp.]|uniref:CobW family GTP-binding protein n=1 Tax=Mangrovibacterium sp. TaxID=1961364 RepID=UPI00356B2F81
MSIPLQLITGFLGSGKTTFLRQYLHATAGGLGEVAIIQNEFSPVNMDGQSLKNDFQYEMLEVNIGSVFCVCLLGSFIDSLRAFAETVKPDLLLMEASGLSDTLGVGQVFQSQKLRGKIYLDKVWCLVDALHFNRASALRLRLEHQIRSADIVVLTKMDLYEGSVEKIKAEIRTLNPFATFVQADHGHIPEYGLKGKPRFFPAESQAGGRPDVESVVIRSSRAIRKEALIGFLKGLNGQCIRAKGYVRLFSGKRAFLQTVFDQVELSELEEQQDSTELVLIGNFNKNTNLQVSFDEHCRL